MFLRLIGYLLCLFVFGCYDSSIKAAEEDTASDTTSNRVGDSVGVSEGTDTVSMTSEDSESVGSEEDTDREETDTIGDIQPVQTPCESPDALDDMESASGHACPHDDRNGVWYVFNDETGGATQWPPITTPGVPAPVSVIPGKRGDSRRAMHTYGEQFSDWGAGIGLDVAYNNGEYGSYDASAYDGVTFWAKSDLQHSVLLRVSTVDTTRIEWGGNCERSDECSWKPHQKEIELFSDWTRYWVPFAELTSEMIGQPPFEREAVTNVQFLYDENHCRSIYRIDYQNTFDFWIDDLSFYGGAPDCADMCESAPPGCDDGVLPVTEKSLLIALRRYVGAYNAPACRNMCQYSSLDLSYLGTRNVEGIDCLYWITALVLKSSDLEDISALSHLSRLKNLILGGNKITDISALAGLSSLVYLDLSDNEISDITPLVNLTELKYLRLDYNNIEDLSPLLKNKGLQYDDIVHLAGFPCNVEGQTEIVNKLKERGVSVYNNECLW